MNLDKNKELNKKVNDYVSKFFDNHDVYVKVNQDNEFVTINNDLVNKYHEFITSTKYYYTEDDANKIQTACTDKATNVASKEKTVEVRGALQQPKKYKIDKNLKLQLFDSFFD